MITIFFSYKLKDVFNVSLLNRFLNPCAYFGVRLITKYLQSTKQNCVNILLKLIELYHLCDNVTAII